MTLGLSRAFHAIAAASGKSRRFVTQAVVTAGVDEPVGSTVFLVASKANRQYHQSLTGNASVDVQARLRCQQATRLWMCRQGSGANRQRVCVWAGKATVQQAKRQNQQAKRLRRGIGTSPDSYVLRGLNTPFL